nr:Rho GDP-dissociation inhibitor 1-like [Tanacetum cinerariifolium]
MTRTDDKEAPPSGSTVDDDSDTSCYATEDEEDTQIYLGPKISIKEHLEKDK